MSMRWRRQPRRRTAARSSLSAVDIQPWQSKCLGVNGEVQSAIFLACLCYHLHHTAVIESPMLLTLKQSDQ